MQDTGWMRAVRKRLNLTVSGVARATGFSRNTVRTAEEGKASLSTVAALARFYGDLLKETNDGNVPNREGQ